MGLVDRTGPRLRPWCIFAALLPMVAASPHAQEPRRSPRETTAIAAGPAGSVTVTYGRPVKNGRRIFGPAPAGRNAASPAAALDAPIVPYKQPWRTGADEATKVETLRPIRFENGRKVLPPGEYRVYTIPDESTWTVKFGRYRGQWGTDFSSPVQLSITCPAMNEAPPREQFTISVTADPSGAPRGELRFEWDTVSVRCPFTVVGDASSPPSGAGERQPPGAAPSATPGVARGDPATSPAPGKVDTPSSDVVKAVVKASRIAQMRDALWKKSYLTLAPNITVAGPVQGTDDAAYDRQVFALLLREADAYATQHAYRLPGLWRRYATFLMGALTVAWHESRWTHARTVPSWSCNGEFQKGPTAGSHQRVFTAQLAGKGHLADCASEPRGSVTQVLWSSDRLSTGIMQVNFADHEDYYVEASHLDMRAGVRHGLKLYAEGFQRIWNTAARYPCLATPVSGRRDGLAFLNVLRAAWAGAYNSWAWDRNAYVYTRACRFTEKTDPRDKEFLNSLGFIRDAAQFGQLGLSPREREVVDNLLEAIEHNTEPRAALAWIDRGGA